MTEPLLTHQVSGALWLSHNGRAYLGDGPGSGKTRTLIAGLQARGAKYPLVVCPAIVRTHWAAELDAMRWFGPRVIASYDEITRGGLSKMAELLRGGVDALVLDEAHYLKHASSRRTQLLLGRDGYARRLETVFLASGTPLPKNPAEIWTVLASLFPEIALKHGLRSREEFVDRFCIFRGVFARGQWREQILGVKADRAEELQSLLGEFLLRREIDVPELRWQTLRLNGGEGALWCEDDSARYAVQAALDAGTLEEIANDPHVARMRRRIGELKVAPVAELVREQLDASEEKLVLFAHHRSVIEGLEDKLVEFNPVVIDGDSTATQREAVLDRFLNFPGTRVFIGQNQATGTGMDGLQRVASRAILVEPSWTAAENVQLGRRVARMGAVRGAGVAQMVALAGTLDDAIVAQNVRETRMVDQALPVESK